MTRSRIERQLGALATEYPDPVLNPSSLPRAWYPDMMSGFMSG